MALSVGQNPLPSLETELSQALALADLDTRVARFDEGLLRFFRQGEFATPLYSAISENPWRAPHLMDVKRRELGGFAGRPSDSLVSLGTWAGWSIRRTLIGNPNAAEEARSKQPNALREVLEQMRERGLLASAPPGLGEIPVPVQQAAALILGTAIRTRDLRAEALREVGDPVITYRRLSERDAAGGVAETNANLRMYRRYRPTLMAAAGHDLLLAVQTGAGLVASVPKERKYYLKLRTSWGSIILTGGTASSHPDEPTLLIVDTGGNDTYLGNPSTHSERNWCSIVLDAAGDDKYVSAVPLQTTPVEQFAGRKTAPGRGPASALMGVSILHDASGDDLYRSHVPGLGSARLGIASLYDGAGDDTYEAYADGLGCGLFGAGLVEDNGTGNDRYFGFNQVQGVGLVGGIGYLVDRGGNDLYSANDSAIDFPSPQSDQHNVSMSQGAGNGRRADYLDGQSIAGGVGVLFDQGGNDRYQCGVFGQGVGYWMGVGSLWDSGGNDSYHGQWYVHGASAHFAIGYLEDTAGNDSYQALMNMAQGAGHDFGIGYLIDVAGDDSYQAPNLSLGAGNANGIGWFADLAGNDRYASSGWTLGKGAEAPANSLRSRALTLGVFMDLGGTDTYPEAAVWAKNSTRTTNWTAKLPLPQESQLGVFVDR